jgi:hypothetical protein
MSAKRGFELRKIMRRIAKYGFILASIVAFFGWAVFLGWMLWYLIDLAFT